MTAPLHQAPDAEERCHCGKPVAYGFDGDPTHHRGMCEHCDTVRCDAYPGACGRRSPDAEERVVAALAEALCDGCGHSVAWHGQQSGCDCYPDGGDSRCACLLTHAEASAPTVARLIEDARREDRERHDRELHEALIAAVAALRDLDAARERLAGVEAYLNNLACFGVAQSGTYEAGFNRATRGIRDDLRAVLHPEERDDAFPDG